MDAVRYIKNDEFRESDGLRENNLGESVTIEKATSTDFERVYPLLLDFNNPRLSRDNWRQIFNPNWNSPENYCGLLLLDGGRVQGYLGLLFSARMIKGSVEKFCNMTSWIVREDYRSQSLRMLLEILKLSDYTITNFTPSPKVRVILKRLGFMEMDINQRILYPVSGTLFPGSEYRCIFDLDAISRRLDPIDQTILFDHRGFHCRHVLVTDTNDYCYLVLKNRIYQHLPFAIVHYISNPDFFLKAIDLVRTKICWKLKVAGLIVDQRCVGAQTFKCSRTYPRRYDFFFKSKSLGQTDIDTLYSEMILLHD
jgi:hypothetical protein